MLSESVQELEIENQAMKKELEELHKRLSEKPQHPKDCAHCKFYLQHYVKVGSVYRETHCGHCTHGISKTRKPNDKCSYFEEGI